jgi:hypothetical protein
MLTTLSQGGHVMLQWVALSVALVTPPGHSSPTSHHFSGLFQVRPGAPADARVTPPPAVRCGMTIITPEGAASARMPRLTPPANRRFTLRVEPPALCGSQREPGRR